MANLKSQIKRNKQNQKQRVRNRVTRGKARTFIKKAQTTIKAGTLEEAKAETRKAIIALDRAVAKGVIHKNNAARRKSRLIKQLNSIQ
ncbi:MAG: 30S ribosomal protein S20 [Anaerolineaceae bacterium]|nr:30S ribosomal protein S20 [Anaerolineaceae bacterium]